MAKSSRIESVRPSGPVEKNRRGWAVAATFVAVISAGVLFVGVNGAWAAEAAPGAKPAAVRPFDDVVLESREGTAFPPAEVEGLLESVGKPLRLISVHPQRIKFQGLGRVREWTPNSLLRFVSLERSEFFRIHVWGKDKGISLRVSPQTLEFAAYRTLAEPASLPPGTTVPYGELLATDDGRALRLPYGTFYLAHHDGLVEVFRGNLPILTVALEGPVKAVYLESPSDMELHDLAVTSATAPAHRPVANPVVTLDGTRPADLQWKETLPEGSRLQKLENGAVELSAEKTAAVAMATLPVSGGGIYSAVFRVENATPGTGIVFLNEAGEPIDGIEYGRDAAGKTVFGYGSPKEPLNVAAFAVENRPMPYAGPTQWLRMIMSGGMTRLWVSSDGLHWGKLFDPRIRGGAWRSLGIFARENPNPQPADVPVRQIRLTRIEVRSLDGLNGVVRTDLLDKAAVPTSLFKPGETVDAWSERIASTAPQGSSPGDWYFACALHVLSHQPSPDLFVRMLSERLENLPQWKVRARLLQDASLIEGIKEEEVNQRMDRWDQVGRDVLHQKDDADFQEFIRMSLAASVPTGHARRGPISSSLATDMLLMLYADQRWPEVSRWAKWLDFWRLGDPPVQGAIVHDRLFDWMRARAESSKRTGNELRARVGRIGPRRPVISDIRQPFLAPMSRSASDVFLSVQSAIEDKQYKEAARLVPGVFSLRGEGLVSAPLDGQLLVSFGGMQRMLLRRKEFADAIGAQLTAVDKLRIEQALAQDDPNVWEDISVQYVATPAAATACQKLGDRALANVDFAAALSWYQQASESASPAQQDELLPRIHLATAGLGYVVAEPSKKPFTLFEKKITPEEFGRKVVELLKKNESRKQNATFREAMTSLPDPPPGPIEVALSAEFNTGNPDPIAVPPSLQGRDWSQGHLAAQLHDDLLLVSNRRRLLAIDGTKPEVRWSWDLGTSWLPSPIRPLVLGSKVFVRTTTAPHQYGVACLDKKSGRPVWIRDCEDRVIGDPQIIHGRVYVLTIKSMQHVDRTANEPIHLVEINAETGDILARRPIGETSTQPSLPHEYQATVVGDRLIVSFSGAVVCLDIQGRVVWFRQSNAIPPENNPAYEAQLFQPPREMDGRIYLQQPGSWAVECLLAETGELLWRRGVLGLQGILDVGPEKIVVKSSRGLAALQTSDGQIVWRREVPGILPATAKSRGNQILCVRQQISIHEDASQLQFQWLDATTGKVSARRATTVRNREPASLGPIVFAGGKTFAVGGRGFSWPFKPTSLPLFEIRAKSMTEPNGTP